LDVVDTGGHLSEIQGLEFYSGLLLPGFILGHSTQNPIKLNQATINSELLKHQRVLFGRGVEAVSDLNELNLDLTGFSMVSLLQEQQIHFPNLSFIELIRKFTIDKLIDANTSDLGEIAQNKKPGILIMTGFNYSEFKVLDTTKITRLV